MVLAALLMIIGLGASAQKKKRLQPVENSFRCMQWVFIIRRIFSILATMRVRTTMSICLPRAGTE